MKKLFLLLMFPAIINAQEVNKFEITPHGVNGFVVQEFENFNKEQLYGKVKKWAEYNFNEARIANSSDVENEYLKYDTYSYSVIEKKGFLNSGIWDLDYLLEFRFKDGKVRYDIKINKIKAVGGNATDLDFQGGFYSFYKENGDVKKTFSKQLKRLNSFLQSFPKRVSKFINEKDPDSKNDW